MIKAITLDCWGTLLLDGPLSDERYTLQRLVGIQAVLTASGVSVSPHDLSRAYAASGRGLRRIWARCRDVPVRQHVVMLLEAVDRTLPGRLGPAGMEKLIEAYAAPALLVPPAIDPGAAAALQKLAESGIVLAMVSNTMRTPGTVLRRILDRSGLLSRFKVLSFSDECGIRKPDPEIFRLTLCRLGASPEEAVHVGDDALLDVEGARHAGMGVIQVAAGGGFAGPIKPDAVIAGLAELPTALGHFRL